MLCNVKAQTLSDYLVDHTPFSDIATLNDPELEVVFSTISGSNLDQLLNQEYGDRTLFRKIPMSDDAFHSVGVLAKYKQTWLKVMELNGLSINLGATNQRILKETITEKVKADNVQDVDNKVSAYNDDELITDTGSNTKGTNNSDGIKERTVEDANININSAINQLTAFQKSNIIAQMLSDVAGYYTISMY